MCQLAGHIQVVEHSWCNPNYSWIASSCRHPGGPGSFALTHENESFQLSAGPFFERIHGTDDALCHRKQERPGRVSTSKELVKRIGDQLVFFPAENRLIRHVEQHRRVQSADCGDG